jgi:SAM-dependent methyltransferase
MPTLTLENFAAAFGVTSDDIPQKAKEMIEKSDFSYYRLSQRERDQVILTILNRLDEGSLAKAGQERHPIWEQAWTERAQNFVASDYALEGLLPNYFDVNPVVRLNGDYVQPAHPGFEQNFSEIIRLWLFTRYLGPVKTIYEFGCGSGFNLVTLGKLYPEKRLYGLDWAMSAVELVNLIAQRQGLKLTGYRFDFFSPDQELKLEEDSAVITMCALEQVGANYEPFIQFLLKQSPTVCVNMEPLCELYNENSLVDYLAIRYHKQRNYLDGYLSRLRQLEAEGKIEIQKTQRPFFGNMYHEGYSFVIWRPVA